MEGVPTECREIEDGVMYKLDIGTYLVPLDNYHLPSEDFARKKLWRVGDLLRISTNARMFSNVWGVRTIETGHNMRRVRGSCSMREHLCVNGTILLLQKDTLAIHITS